MWMDNLEYLLWRLSRQLLQMSETNHPENQPYVEFTEDETSLRIVAELPGVRPEDIAISAMEGEVEVVVRRGGAAWYSEAFESEKIDPNALKISFRNGVLQIDASS
jgi:HSP20 family molecular chaperone IbpA